MNPILYIIVFIQIVIKGCMESGRIKTAIVTGLIVAATLFVPYWAGLLTMYCLGMTAVGVTWPIGLATLAVITGVSSIISLIYIEIRTWFN